MKVHCPQSNLEPWVSDYSSTSYFVDSSDMSTFLFGLDFFTQLWPFRVEEVKSSNFVGLKFNMKFARAAKLRLACFL